MKRMFLDRLCLFWFVTLLVSGDVLAQSDEMAFNGDASSLGKIDVKNDTKLNGFFDFNKNRLHYQVQGSNVADFELFKFHQVPWDVQPLVPYQFDAKQKFAGIVLENPKLQLLARWDDARADLLENPSYKKLEAAFEKIPEDSLWIPEQNRAELRNATVAAVVDGTVGDPTHEVAVDLFYLSEKSYHGNRQISFSVFEQARGTCLAACAIRRRGASEPHGSGVLIGNGVVLTSKHNFKDNDNAPANCEVLFHYTDKDPGAVYAIASEYYSSQDLDFSLIELGGNTKPAADETFRLPAPPKLGTEPELKLNSGIYVAGHPQGKPLSVALNAQVVFPYRLEDQKALDYLSGLALLRMFSSPSDYAAHSLQLSETVELFFKTQYRASENAGLYFRPNNIPTIGADPDTKHGNSGSPAFDLDRNAVIGILRAGSPDFGNFPTGATYTNFEAIVPISQIVDELKKSKPDWKEKFGVKYFGE